MNEHHQKTRPPIEAKTKLFDNNWNTLACLLLVYIIQYNVIGYGATTLTNQHTTDIWDKSKTVTHAEIIIYTGYKILNVNKCMVIWELNAGYNMGMYNNLL